MSKNLRFSILTPGGESKKYDFDVAEVIFPTGDGQIGVLPSHEPLMSTVGPGALKIRILGKEKTWSIFTVTSGVCTIKNNKIGFAVSAAIPVTEKISVEKALAQLEEASTLYKKAINREGKIGYLKKYNEALGLVEAANFMQANNVINPPV